LAGFFLLSCRPQEVGFSLALMRLGENATNLTSCPNEIINKFNQHLIGHLGFKALRLSNQAPLESNQNAIAQAGSFAG